MDDLLWIGPALIAGIAVAHFGLPPIVGYLLCGFALNFSGAYDHDRLAPDYSDLLIGIDSDPDIIATHKAAGRNAVFTDVTDDETWDSTPVTGLEVGILALGDHQENLAIVNRVSERKRDKKIFAVASHEDEVAELVDAGAEAAWNIYSEAGIGLASKVISYYKDKETNNSS